MARKSNDFGGQLRVWRRELELSLVDVADAAGISIVYMSDIERGKRNPPSEEIIRKIARKLKKENEVDSLIQLAARQRRSVEIAIDGKRTPPALAEVLVALARRCDAGDVDEQFVKQLQSLLAKESRQ